ncbi:hypothetical protein [Arcobacter sp. LA11]|uniref:hypothetical protein n=1 Tax=Arcobacter sp. LA11 TaxID=1898176 RepID=UPI00093434FC|nr:hypothetical protein [Arcobacter sp. LA11]
MGNEYNVIEKAIIKCACGGKVSLTSSAKVERIAGEKPLYLNDIIGAPVACPRSKNKCSVVASISMAGTESNVCSTSEYFLLRTDGFTTDKGRAVILSNPGQGTSKIAKVPSVENLVVQEDEPLEKVVREEKKKEYKRKYALYFLRKSEDVYKPLRPTREFIKADETFLSKDGTLDIKDNIHVHTFAYIYITQENKTIEYKVISKGTLYSEELKEIFFKNTQTNVEYTYIPLEKDTKVDISYSSIKLQDKKDIVKLKRLSIDPKQPDQKDYFYLKDAQGINDNEITKETLETQKKFKQSNDGKQKRLNILCIIEDILGEIEDMYVKYYNNYKLAYAHNHSIIEDIKKNNLYTYTIANMVDYFYVSKDETKTYKDSIQELKIIYNDMISLLLSDTELTNLLTVEKDISKILEKDIEKVAQSYFQQIQFLKKDFFKDRYENKNSVYYSKTNFRTANRYVYLTDSIRKTNRRYVANMSRSGMKPLEFNSTNDDYTQIKNNASHVLAHVLFSLVYSEKFEKELKSTSAYSKLNKLRNNFLIKLRGIAPKPNISDKSIEDMQDVVEKQTIYHDIMVKPQSFRDKFLEEYEDLDYVKSIKSFEQKGDKVSFKSKYIYSQDINYYKNDIEKPMDIMKKIAVKLKDAKLKELLRIYEGIENTDKLNYVVSAMNIIYLLSAPRTYLDQETDINSFFNDELTHIYDFVVDMTKKKIALSDKQKETLRFEYQVSETYSSMQMNLILNDIIFSNSKKKALKFIEKFKVAVETDTKKDINYKYIHDQDQNIKSLQREYYEALKNIEGNTSNIDKILVEFTKDETKRISISQKSATYLSSGLKTYGNIIAIAKVSDYLFFDDSKKNIKTHIGFVNDLTAVTVSLGLLVGKYPRTPMKVLELFLKTNTARGIKLSSKKLLNFIEQKAVAKIAVITIVITTAYDVVTLYKREDYDALVVTTALAGVSLALILTIPATPAIILGAIVAIIGGLILNEIIDSDLDIYLKKSLLYKTIDFSIWKNLRGIAQDKKYQAPYLFETTNQKKELKTISSDGFNTPKKLVNFIGENYKGNEKYFDTSLRNELSFFKSSIFGYKLELLDETKRVKKLKNKYNVDVTLYEKTFVKIPKIIADDKDFKFIFESDGKYQVIKKSSLILENDYNIYDLFNQNFTNLDELKTINYKEASILVISSQVELKYDFVYSYKDLNYLFALNFEQSSFTLQDVEELEKLIEKKEDTK